ncbi:MAG: protein-methionine-sulfoxide reductase heme-binding subunit MsrQ [Rhodospirillaceae bacterium]|nr:protein-methionine-sulfoxide reductase heme-binding subunit MsrQ [Rhodospirillaceae bacterium]
MTADTGAASSSIAANLKRAFKPVVFALACLPVAWLAYRGLTGALGANPIETLIRYNGDWALRFLLIALSVTPLRLVTGWTDIMRVRRMLGLFAFFYVCLHMLAYVGLDQFFNWSAIWKDVVKRIYITIGMAAFLTLIPLAVTSTNAMVKRLGARNWRRLHRAVYGAAVAGVIHYALMIKAGYVEPAIYGAILLVLLAVRAARKWP